MSDKEKIRKHLRRADDALENVKRKMQSVDGALFFILQGMEYFYQQDNSYDVCAVEMIRDYLTDLQSSELAELEKHLEHLRKI